MARPAKAVFVNGKHLTKEEQTARLNAEQALKCCGKPKPPAYLTQEQKKIFKRVCKLLEGSDILSAADDYVLAAAAIAIDRLMYIEGRINEAPGLITDKELMSAKDRYTKDFFRCCNELCLSPQSRAKMGVANLNAARAAEDPLLAALKGLNEDG